VPNTSIVEPDKVWYPCQVCGCSGYDEQINDAITRLQEAYKDVILTFDQAEAWAHLEKLKLLNKGD